MIEIGDEESCVGNAGLLVPKKSDGKSVIAVEEDDWNSTIGESVLGLLLSPKLEEVMTEIVGDEICVDITVECLTGLLRLNKLEFNTAEDAEDDNREETVRGSKTSLVLSNRLEVVMKETVDEESCVGNGMECKAGLLVGNETEGAVGIVAVESDWEATVRERFISLL